MTQSETTFEYAIEVPGRGYILETIPLLSLGPIVKYGCRTIEEADNLLNSAVGTYTRMGCPEIAESLVIVCRAVTMSRSDWAREWPESRRASERLAAKK